jgi:hypothetical protein
MGSTWASAGIRDPIVIVTAITFPIPVILVLIIVLVILIVVIVVGLQWHSNDIVS